MDDKGRLAVGAAVTLLLLLAPAFVFHAAPRFPGSLGGSLLGIAAAVLMLLLLVYPAVKYAGWLRHRLGRWVSMRALLSFHVYAGVIAALLGILHTGHKYQSPLGVALVVTMLIAVVTGFVGRYYMPQVSADLRDQQVRLGKLRSVFDQVAADVAGRQEPTRQSMDPTTLDPATVPVLQLVDGIADLEYAVEARTALKAVFTRWIVLHVVASILMYLLLALHVAGEIYFGLRWLP